MYEIINKNLSFMQPVVMHFACMMCDMSMEEAIVGATINAACSLGLSPTHGSLEVGKVGDFVLADVPR